jgi:ABC-type branched-subunit amino acid transport system ATPase component/branched-subunit amino acid ABC-type transport system permease component
MDHVNFLLLGLGGGAVFAALAVGLVVAYRGSGTVNFAAGAMALYSAYTYALLRDGLLLIPIPGLPSDVRLADQLPVPVAFAGAVGVSALLGYLVHVLIFKHLRAAPPIARAVASVGVMLVIQAVLALQLGTEPRTAQALFTNSLLKLGPISVPANRVWTATAIAVLAGAVALLYRRSRFGLETTAVAETEVGAVVSGVSADRTAALNWILASVIGGVAGILIAPIVGLSSNAYSLFIVPALAAGLCARFTRVGIALAVGMGIGVAQSELTKLSFTTHAFSVLPFADLVPLGLILGVLILHGSPLPTRGVLQRRSVGGAPRANHILACTVLWTAVAAFMLVSLSGGYRAAFLTSVVSAILMLSFVVVTGFLGQVSLAQMALAGIGAFSVSSLSTNLGIPFPVAPLLAAGIAGLVGLVVALPGLRVRSYGVAIATLALAVGVDAVWFRNNSFNGGADGARPSPPSMFGIDLSVGRGAAFPRLGFGLLCIGTLCAVSIGVAMLRRSRVGEAMLAISINERSAAAGGVRIRATKLIGFAISGAIAGLAGSLLAYQQTSVSSGSYAPILGLTLFATAYLAGVTSVSGAVVGGLLAPGGLVVLVLDRNLSAGKWAPLIAGVGLVVTVIANPEGVVGPVHAAIARFRARRRPATQAPAASVAIEVRLSAVPDAPPSGPDPLLSLHHVTVRYSKVTAVDAVDMSVPRGAIVGVIGPNGAGKTTLIDAVTGFATHEGVIKFDGQDLVKQPPDARARAGLIRTFQGVELYDALTVSENIEVGTLARSSASERAFSASTDEVLELLTLGPLRDRPVRELSHGQRQLVSIGRALAGRPSLLLLDEPAAGFDPTEGAWLADRLRSVRDAGVTLLLVEHDIELVMELCEIVNVLDLGRCICSGTPAEVRQHQGVIDAYLGSAAVVEASTPEEHEAARGA